MTSRCSAWRVAHHPVAFEQAVHEARDDLRMLLGEALVHDEHVGDDEQVAVRGEHVRLAAALLDDLGRLRRPGDAAGNACSCPTSDRCRKRSPRAKPSSV